ncbi:Protein TAR1 [Quillaja saponaria]|uniref:Protein TAR1 n=1 Tax=Quillaja saponaria TaxID=32244 RepID=A0AAD7P3E0_QUISA|nr:Protein TAR1 [Quillaja saponaria]
MLSLEPFSEDQGRSGGAALEGFPTSSASFDALRAASRELRADCRRSTPRGAPTDRPRSPRTTYPRGAKTHARAWRRTHPRRQRPEVDRRNGVKPFPHPTGTAIAGPPSASLPTISSTSLTLFSKVLFIFSLAGTCLYMSSRQYLALDRIYCPIGAAFPNNPTRPTAPRGATGVGHYRALTLSGAPSRELGPGPYAEDGFFQDYNSDAEGARFHGGPSSPSRFARRY